VNSLKNSCCSCWNVRSVEAALETAHASSGSREGNARARVFDDHDADTDCDDGSPPSSLAAAVARQSVLIDKQARQLSSLQATIDQLLQ